MFYEPAGLDLRCADSCGSKFEATVGGKTICVDSCAEVNQYEVKGAQTCAEACGGKYYAGTRCVDMCAQKVFISGSDRYCVAPEELPSANAEKTSDSVKCA